MGGTHGDVRGCSKIEAYCNYMNVVEQSRSTFSSHYPDPKNKKRCKSLMEQDPVTREWVLQYHLHT